jgi:hypothetical protein
MKEPKIITICLFAVNFIIGQFTHQSYFYSILSGVVSVFIYWMLDYYIPDMYLRIKYHLHKHDDQEYFAIYIYSESNEAVKHAEERIEFSYMLNKHRGRNKLFSESFEEFMEIIRGIYFERCDPTLNGFVYEIAKDWLMAFGYNSKNFLQLAEELPGINVMLRNIQMKKAIDRL